MLPATTVNYLTDVDLTDVEATGEINRSDAIAVQGADVSDHILSQPTPRVSFADDASSFGNHVGCIVRAGTQKKMVRVHAMPNVAAMANEHSVWDRAEVEFIREPMNADSMGGRMDGPVAVPVEGPFPEPARRRLFDMKPEAFGGCVAGIVLGHRSYSFGVTPQAVVRDGAGVFACLYFTSFGA